MDDDSETLPAEINFRNTKQLKDQLSQICGIVAAPEKPIVIVLDKREILASTDKLLDEETYNLGYKVKSALVKIYLCKA